MTSTNDIRRGFLDDIARQRLAPRIAGLQRPLLVVHSAADSVVPIDDGYDYGDLDDGGRVAAAAG